ncbi:MAG: hypothetical protein JW910_12615, partial [Anaerolineae bacterium]|nr:hypothetical protein [Anaerolineae bacterium]
LEGVKARDLDKWTLRALGGDDLTYQDAMLLLSTEAQSMESGSDGDSLWYNLLIPRCKLAYLGPTGVNMRGENIFRFHVKVRPTDTYPWGETFSLTNDGVTRAPIFEWITENRVTMDTIALEAATAQITLSYTPAMDDPADGNGILFYVDGVDTAMLTVVPSTKVVTFSAPGAPATGVVVYERAA